MEQPAINENFVRQYLLGLLPEDERERLEMSLLTNDRIYETLTALEDEVEDELIDQYLDDELTESEREKFERVFLKTPGRAIKLKLIKDLKDHQTVPAYRETPSGKIPASVRNDNWIPAVSIFQNPLFGLSCAAALTVALLCCVWLWIRANGLEGQLRQARIQQTTDATLNEQVEQLKLRNEELTGKLQTSEAQRTTLEQYLASLRTGGGSPDKTSRSNSTFALVVLSPSLRSTDQTVSTLTIPPGVARALLILNLKGLDRKAYKSVRAIVKKQGGPEVWRHDDVNLQPSNGKVRAILTIPVERLADGRHIVELEGVTTDGQTEPIGLYPFQVVHSDPSLLTAEPLRPR